MRAALTKRYDVAATGEPGVDSSVRRLDTPAAAAANAAALGGELAWFARLLAARIDRVPPAEVSQIQPPPVDSESVYGQFVTHYAPCFEERVLLVLGLVPHVRPELLDSLLARHDASADGLAGRGHTEVGGLRAQSHGGFLPTAETAFFLLAGDDLARRFSVARLFDGDHFFAAHGILALRAPPGEEPATSGQLCVHRSFVDLFTVGRASPPAFGASFPAKPLVTGEEWSDLVVDAAMLDQIDEIRAWIHHGQTLMQDWGYARRMKPGFRALFYGPSGTGKTMTAALLGKDTGRDVYRVDLSMVISKYIGETEKNLARVFDQAERHDWILFFDEADALFGKRASVKDAHDRYANQEVAYLLQRVEEYDGVAILASNMKEHIDDAFTRRFHCVIHFPLPDAEQRQRLWDNAFTDANRLDDDVDLRRLAREFELSGGAIMNVVRYAALMALRRDSEVIRRRDLQDGVSSELRKEGRSA